ncbi:PD-(D/E)XK nuclease family protein [Bradyrhizobium ivorense]|uniref:PD-(D/E)XK nuclease family protein n=1 Tax=Bradyrhizobium ivorense TaxID=2511166 RepID=UPI003D319A90
MSVSLRAGLRKGLPQQGSPDARCRWQDLRRHVAGDPTRADTRSWSEVSFGQEMPTGGDLPWDETIKIPIEQAGLVYGGRIDRLDIRASGDGVQITDYKSIEPPPKSQRARTRTRAPARALCNGRQEFAARGQNHRHEADLSCR